MARLVEETIISETDTELVVRFTRRNGRYIERTINKIEGLTNEELLKRWHHRITLEVLQNRILPHKWNIPDTPQPE